jgi:hypothetical protein
MDTPGLQDVKKMYEKLNYFDQYGGSVILFVIITIILILLVSYCFIMIQSQPIIDDWPNQRCKPNIIPFAGFITHPDGVSAMEYTSQNFTYCVQNNLSSITGAAIEPFNYIINIFKSITGQMDQDLQNTRGMLNKIRSFFQNVTEEIMGRVVNVTVPLQQIVISFKDLISKIQGTMTAGLFTLFGSYYTLKSFLGVIAQFIIAILITFAATIAALWAVPLTWGAAAANTAVFVAISIPMVIVLTFMTKVLNIKNNLKVPKIKCFDKNTPIKMNDGTYKKIINIAVGDILRDNNEVTACFKLITRGSIMYKLGTVIVSDSHIVNYNGTWLHVSEHPHAIKYEYNEPFLYCLNTSNKTIVIDNYIFTDWDEIYDTDMNNIQKNSRLPIKTGTDLHYYLDGGFNGSTKIKLENGSYKEIKNIEVDDVLENGEIVYGTVKINGNNVNDQFLFNLGNFTFEGGPNLAICDKKITVSSTLELKQESKIKLKENQNLLYHLLTNTKTFNIDKIKFYDYIASIDLFLDKNKEKLLSIKYV